MSWWRARRTACSTVAGQAHEAPPVSHGSWVWEEAAREGSRASSARGCLMPDCVGDADHAAAGLRELVNGACHVAC